MANWLITGCSELLTLRGPVPRRGARTRQSRGDSRWRAAAPRRSHRRRRPAAQHRAAARGARRGKARSRRPRRAAGIRRLAYAPDFSRIPRRRARAAHRRENVRRNRARGGGIRSTVKALRRARPAALLARAAANLREFAAHGTTTLEAKSGYGLSWESEQKILEILRELHQAQPLDIACTFLGAHVVPPEFQPPPGRFRRPARQALDSRGRHGGPRGILRRLLRSRRVHGRAGAPDSRGRARLRPRAANPRRATRAHRRRAPRDRNASRQRRSSRKDRPQRHSRALAFRRRLHAAAGLLLPSRPRPNTLRRAR